MKGTAVALAGFLLAAAVPAVALLISGQIQLATVVIAFGAFLLLVSRRPRSHVAFAAALFMFAHTEIAHTSSAVEGASRAAALLVLGMGCLQAGYGQTTRTVGALIATMVGGGLAYGSVVVVHGVAPAVLLAAATFIVVTVALLQAASRIPSTEIQHGLELVMALALASCLLMGVFVSSVGLEANRLEGIFTNANTCGFFAALGLVLTLVGKRRRLNYFLASVATFSLLWSASRSALLALAVSLLACAIRLLFTGERDRRVFRATVVGALLSGAVLLFVNTTDVLILRTNDSRGGGTEYALAVASADPWSGVGYQGSVVEIASSPLRWLAEAGILGLGAVLLAYVLILLLAWRSTPAVLLVTTVGVASSLFEGWFFAGGSALFFTFWLVYLVAFGHAKDSLFGRAANPAENARI